PVEERAVGDGAADEEDPQRVHVSDRVAASRADRSSRPTMSTPIAVYRAPSPAHMPMSPSNEPPPLAASRIARIPQVGASTHEIGRTQPGNSDRGTRKPQISQTGYSRRFPSAQADR